MHFQIADDQSQPAVAVQLLQQVLPSKPSVNRESFSIGDVSVDAQAARIKASGAQVVFALPNGTSFGTALHGLYDVGLDVPVYTSAANFSPALLERFTAFLPKELTCAGPSFFTYAFAWDPALIVVSAFRALGTNATAAQVHDYIEGQRRFAGVQGIYDFTTRDQHGLSEAGMLVLRSDPAHPGRPIVVSKQGAIPL